MEELPVMRFCLCGFAQLSIEKGTRLMIVSMTADSQFETVQNFNSDCNNPVMLDCWSPHHP